MCKYCEFNEDGSALKDFSECHDMGFMGDFNAFAGIEKDEHGEHKLNVWMAIDSNPCSDASNLEGIISYDVLNKKINYCPMCGRKLGENAES